MMSNDSFLAIAEVLARRVAASGTGFLTMRRDDLRATFGIGRISEGLAEQVFDALVQNGCLCYPHPFAQEPIVRVYSLNHPVGAAAHAVVFTGESTEAPLRRLAALHERAEAARAMRSADIPWIEAFDILLQLVLGRSPVGWEDVTDDRHGSTLARDLGLALELPVEILTENCVKRLAICVQTVRPRNCAFVPEDLAPPSMLENATVLVEYLRDRCAQMERTHQEVLRASAQLVLNGRPVPMKHVEVGLLGLRRIATNEGKQK